MNRRRDRKGLTFDRPIVVLQSDDWGRVGMRDREGLEELRTAGIQLGENAYDFYTLETADDVYALHETLARHSDCARRNPSLVMNFVMANLDFAKMEAGEFRKIHLLPLPEGLPSKWNRPGLFDAYRTGIAAGTFYPALHGLTHFCRDAVESAANSQNEDARLLRTFWKSQTPYIYSRTPWVGYEYWHPATKEFLKAAEQQRLIREGSVLFERMFGFTPRSACAPGYRSNEDTDRAWHACGIRIVQNGSGDSGGMYVDDRQVLRVFRDVDFEPATEGEKFSLAKCVRQAQRQLDRGVPAVVSMHAINFHSSVRDFRSRTLGLLDEFLTILEARYPELLYVNDAELYDLATRGLDAALPLSTTVHALSEAQTGPGRL